MGFKGYKALLAIRAFKVFRAQPDPKDCRA
jgi:hypothetical protein